MEETPDQRTQLPDQPVKRLLEPINRFMHVEAAGGIVLLACTIVALALANSPAAEAFLGFWKMKVGFTVGPFEMYHSLKHWINDGLMAIFFFVIGLEVKRELVLGELRDMRRAALPIAAALGGMIVPAGVYLAFQYGQEGQSGWGIPMATDIAFVVGCMALLGPRIPHGFRVLVLSLAIADDIGAILVIAVGYTESIDLIALALGFVGVGLLSLFIRIGIRNLPVYAALAFLIWLAFHESGVHATIAGVIIGLMTPVKSYLSEGLFGEYLGRARTLFEGGNWGSVSHRAEKVRFFQWVTRETISPLEYLEHSLHPWVGFVIMPVFALANAGVPIHLSDLASPVALAVMAGLVVGKPLGIFLFSFVAVKANLARLPDGVDWTMLVAGGFLAGIGFTMALFISGLALQGTLLDVAKIGVLAGSVASAIVGMGLLISRSPKSSPDTD